MQFRRLVLETKRQRDEGQRLSEFKDLKNDPHPRKTGVLLSDEIEFYACNYKMIKPFIRKNIKPAAYELTVGDEVMVEGEFVMLGDGAKDGTLRIPPFDVAVIKTGETLNLPRFIIGRWNIRTRWAYKGLIWAGGPQVDPGYVGHLFCPIYNLSAKPFYIRKGEPFAVFDFVKTTDFNPNRKHNEEELYNRPPRRLVIEDFEIDDFRSGPFETKNDLDKVSRKIDVFTALIFVVLAILMTAVALPYFSSPPKVPFKFLSLEKWALVISIAALLMSILGGRGYLWRKLREWKNTRPWLFGGIVISVAGIVIWVAYFLGLYPYLNRSDPLMI